MENSEKVEISFELYRKLMVHSNLLHQSTEVIERLILSGGSASALDEAREFLRDTGHHKAL